MIGTKKSLIYSILEYNPSFILWFKKEGQLKKKYPIKKINKNCKILGNCEFISRYDDKISINGINYDTFKTNVTLKIGNDIYTEELHEQINHLGNFNRYNSIVNYSLKKNNESICYDNLDPSVLKVIK